MAYTLKESAGRKAKSLRPNVFDAAAPGSSPTPASSSPLPSAGGSGRYTNFSRYLAANRDVSQREGDKLASAVAREGATAEGSIKSAGEQFAKDATEATPKYYGEKIGAYDDQGEVGFTRDQAVAKSQEKYSGPGSLNQTQQFAALNSQADAAAQKARLAATGAGRQVLLPKASSAGGGRLDGALTGAASGRQLGQVRNRYGNLQQFLQNAVAQSVARANAAKAASDAAAAKYAQDVANYDAQPATAAGPSTEEIERQRAEQARAKALYEGYSPQDQVAPVSYDKVAAMDGLYDAWANAGKPWPYDAWKEQYLASR